MQTGGAGRDLFDYDAVGDSPWSAACNTGDRITDFTYKLTGSTSRPSTPLRGRHTRQRRLHLPGCQGGGDHGGGPGALVPGGRQHLHRGEAISGDTHPELQIQLDGLKTVTASDFVL
ncbi:MAG: hypothetical protein U1E17_04660 [Geminicoccaceae bacterium]